MAIKIETSKREIPIEIGEHTLYFIRSNENIMRIENSRDTADKVRQVIGKKKSMKDAFPDIEQFLKEELDGMLGEGAYEKICEVSPDSIDRSWVYMQVVYGILGELEKTGDIESMKQKARKYIQKK